MVICIYVYVYILPYICMYVCMYVYYHIYIYRVGIYRSTQSSHAEVIEDCLYIARAKYLHLLQLRLVSCSLDQLVAAQISQQQLRLVSSSLDQLAPLKKLSAHVWLFWKQETFTAPKFHSRPKSSPSSRFFAPLYIHTHIYIYLYQLAKPPKLLTLLLFDCAPAYIIYRTLHPRP